MEWRRHTMIAVRVTALLLNGPVTLCHITSAYAKYYEINCTPHWGGDAETLLDFATGCGRVWVRVVWEYHAAWLQLLEQGQATRMDEGERTELRHLMVWSKPSLSSRFSNPPPTPVASTGSQPPLPFTNQGRVGRYNYVSQASKSGDRACLAFNRGSFHTQASHPSDLHVCAYYLRVAQKLCRHPEGRCNHKAEAKNRDGGV